MVAVKRVKAEIRVEGEAREGVTGREREGASEE
jgi:hypothetical protein